MSRVTLIDRNELLTMQERIAFLESREVCGAAHDDVAECGYCQRDALAANLAAAEARVAELEAGWQPIETAPNEGAFLVTDGSYIAEVFSKRRGSGFSTTVDGYVFADATHWMPNPALPSDPPSLETQGKL